MLIAEQAEIQSFVAKAPEIGFTFDHLGVVADKLERGRQYLSRMLDIWQWTEPIRDDEIGVRVQFGQAPGGPCYELIEPLVGVSPVTGALRSGRHILNHVAYRALDFARAGQWLTELGCVAIAPPQRAVAYADRRVQFWMTPLRFLVEVVDAPEHEHQFVPEWTPWPPSLRAERDVG